MTVTPARRLWSLALWLQYRSGVIDARQVEAGWDTDPPEAFQREVAHVAVDDLAPEPCP